MQAVSATEMIVDPRSKAEVLRAIASTYGELSDAARAQSVLAQALLAIVAISDPDAKAEALSAIAIAYSKLANRGGKHILSAQLSRWRVGIVLLGDEPVWAP